MILQLALILVAIGVFSSLWAITEILLIEIFLRDRTKLKRSENDHNPFDKQQQTDYNTITFNNNRRSL